MASIANYLKQNGWQNHSMVLKKKAIFAYNHCDNYVEAVFAYAKAMARS
jgi:membrane-bound lytic murein transglycosylase B